MTLLSDLNLYLNYFAQEKTFNIKKIKELVRIKRASYVLILYALFIAFAIIVISPEKSGAEFIFVFTPLSIISTNYLETIEDKWFGELFMWLLVVTVIVILVLQFNAIG